MPDSAQSTSPPPHSSPGGGHCYSLKIEKVRLRVCRRSHRCRKSLSQDLSAGLPALWAHVFFLPLIQVGLPVLCPLPSPLGTQDRQSAVPPLAQSCGPSRGQSDIFPETSQTDTEEKGLDLLQCGREDFYAHYVLKMWSLQLGQINRRKENELRERNQLQAHVAPQGPRPRRSIRVNGAMTGRNAGQPGGRGI